MRLLPALLALTLMGACGPEAPLDNRTQPATDDSVGLLAEEYVRLVLALGEHDADYVDAYIGPEEWREEARATVAPLTEIDRRAREGAERLAKLDPGEDIEEPRFRHLEKSYASLAARIAMLSGEPLSFDEESLALYDAVAPTHGAAHYQAVLDRLSEALPGDGSIAERYEAFRSDFVIPTDRLTAVLDAAVAACRERTLAHMELPEDESFQIEFVTDKSWSGYNWYQGDYHSLIQINTDLPIYVDRMLDLACHEGYPGHHVYSMLVERDLVRKEGWVEFAVYPLFSPRSLIAEGSANYGIEVAFPAEERVEFERRVLFPLAGLEPATADAYYEIQNLLRDLQFAGNEAARRYLDGEFDVQQAADWLSTYSLMPASRAEQRVRFIDQYRSYVINYNLGQELVRDYIEARGGTADDPERRWSEFATLLSSPKLPSQLATP